MEKNVIKSTKWETWTLIPAGAGWMFAVGIVEQDGRRRVRIAKGKQKVADAGELPIAQQARLNLKPSDWKHLRDAIDRYIAQLQEDNSKERTPAGATARPSLQKHKTPEQLAHDFTKEQAAAYTDLEPD